VDDVNEVILIVDTGGVRGPLIERLLRASANNGDDMGVSSDRGENFFSAMACKLLRTSFNKFNLIGFAKMCTMPKMNMRTTIKQCKQNTHRIPDTEPFDQARTRWPLRQL
jgi:hypothetical protein